MTRLGRLIRNILEWWLGKYYEGEEPPRRLRDEVYVWHGLHPLATDEQWRAMAIEHARNAYKEGFARGFEWAERAWEGPEYDPDVLAKIVEPPEESMAEQNEQARELIEAAERGEFPGVDDAAVAHYYRDLGRNLGTHRVIIVDPDDES